MISSTKNFAFGGVVNCFQLLSGVLDETWKTIPGNDKARLAAVQAVETALSAHYAKLTTTKTRIDYAQAATRYLYMAKYVSSHANMVYDVIQQEKELQKILKAQKIKITCIGGGPGSDLLGVLKYIQKHVKTPPERVKFFLYDAEKLSPPAIEGPTFTGITGAQGPGR